MSPFSSLVEVTTGRAPTTAGAVALVLPADQKAAEAHRDRELGGAGQEREVVRAHHTSGEPRRRRRAEPTRDGTRQRDVERRQSCKPQPVVKQDAPHDRRCERVRPTGHR